MICPKCRKPIEGTRCECGFNLSLRWLDPSEPNADSLALDIESRSLSDPAAWRDDMSKRFEERPPEPIADDTAEREEFDLKLNRSAESAEELPEEPLAGLTDLSHRRPVAPSPRPFPRAERLEQRKLTLDPPPADFPNPVLEPDDIEDFTTIPREVIFTRLLAGTVDLLVPVVVGLIFVFSASWLLNFEFFSPGATRLWIGLAVGCFLFNSLFFLWTSGQTPGMYLTELRVIDRLNGEPTLSVTALRVVLFLVSLATVLGLLLAVFDPQCRALHDRLTGTKVVPEIGLPE